MAWADNWTAPGYALKSADVLALYNALRERASVLLDYPYYQAALVDEIAAAYPLGVDRYHNPKDLAHPEYIPAHLQAFDLWNKMKMAVSDMMGTLFYPNQIAAYDKDNDLDGQAFLVSEFSAGHGAGVSFFSPYVFSPPANFDPIGKIRARAGLPMNHGETITTDGWRRRCPRFVLSNALTTPQDRDGNAAAEGQRAWEITSDYDYLPVRQAVETPTGRLIQWDSALGRWKHQGQASGEMPDRLDSTLAPPNYTAPGRYGKSVYRGDYLDTVLTNEIKQVLKKLVAWGWFVNWSDSEYKYGDNLSNTSYTLAKSNADSAYAGAAVVAAAGGEPHQYAYGGYFAGSATPYSARIESRRTKAIAPFNNRVARSIKWFAGTSLYAEPSGGAGTENVFDNAGLAYVGDHVWKLFDSRVSGTAGDVPHGAGVAPDMVSNWLGQLTPYPAFPGFPFAGNPDRFRGWEVHYGIAVADYTPGFVYT